MKSGAIDIDTHNRKAQQLREELTRPDRLKAEQNAAAAARESTKIQEEELKRIAAAKHEAAQEEAALDREAAKLREASLTPLQRYNRELERLDVLLKKGKISQEEHGRAAKQAAEGFDKGSFDTHEILTQNIADVKSWALSLVGGGGVLGAVELVVKQLEEWRDRLKEIGEQNDKMKQEAAELAKKPECQTPARSFQVWTKWAALPRPRKWACTPAFRPASARTCRLSKS